MTRSVGHGAAMTGAAFLLAAGLLVGGVPATVTFTLALAVGFVATLALIGAPAQEPHLMRRCTSMVDRGSQRGSHGREAGKEARPRRCQMAGTADTAHRKETPMHEPRTIAPNEDPVCGMTVEPTGARAKSLVTTLNGTEYVFCGKGCMLEFGDAPETYLDQAYVAAM
jgi:YHS domain-containing protein